MEVEVLYTHQIQKKNKAFRDGSIKITPGGAVLRDDNEFAIDSHAITAKFRADWDAGVENFHFEKHLVQVPSERPMFGGGQRANPAPSKPVLRRPEAAPFKPPRRTLVPVPEGRVPASTAFKAPKRETAPREANTLWDSPAPKVAKREDPWGSSMGSAKDPQVGLGDTTEGPTAEDPWAAWTKQNDANNDDDPWAAFLPDQEPRDEPPAPKLGPSLNDLLRARGKTFALPPKEMQEEEDRKEAEAAAAWGASAARVAGRNGQPIIGHESEELRSGAQTNRLRETTTAVNVPPQKDNIEVCSGAQETKNTSRVASPASWSGGPCNENKELAAQNTNNSKRLTTSASWDGRRCEEIEELAARKIANTEGGTTSVSWDGRQEDANKEFLVQNRTSTEGVTTSASWDSRQHDGTNKLTVQKTEGVTTSTTWGGRQREGSEDVATAASASKAPFTSWGDVQSSRLLGADQDDVPMETDFFAASAATTIRGHASSKSEIDADRRRHESFWGTEFEHTYEKTKETTDAVDVQWGGALSSSDNDNAWRMGSTPEGDPLALWNADQMTTHTAPNRPLAPEASRTQHQESGADARDNCASTSSWYDGKPNITWQEEKPGAHTGLHGENRKLNTALNGENQEAKEWQESQGPDTGWQETHRPSWSDTTWDKEESNTHWSTGCLNPTTDSKSGSHGVANEEPAYHAVENVQSRPTGAAPWGAAEGGVERFHSKSNTDENRTSASAPQTNLISPGGGRWDRFVE